jgi:hypothetical protein
MPVETFAFINGLVPTNPIHTDPLSEADQHLRGIKQTLVNTFPNVAGTIAAGHVGLNAAGVAFTTPGLASVAANGTTAGGGLQLLGVTAGSNIGFANTGTVSGPPGLTVVMAQGTSAVAALTLTMAGALHTAASVDAPSIKKNGSELLPSGLISMWFGTLGSIPAGWVLCDGTNSTPDLRNRFVLGAGGSGYTGPGGTGGAFTATATTSASGSHSHGGQTEPGGGISMAPSTSTNGAHSHAGATAGYALTVNDLPPHQHNVPGMVIGATTAGQSYYGLGADQSLSGVTSSSSVQNTSVSSPAGAGFGHAHGINSDGDHVHSVTIITADHRHAIDLDGSHAHTVTASSTPPYYALAYIMKV